MNKSLKSTFESIILIKKIPYWLYWLIIGTTGFIFGEFLFNYLGEQPFIIDRVIGAYTITIIPILNIWLFYSFRKTLKEIINSVWERDEAAESWLQERESRIFTLRQLPAKLVTGFIVISGLITIAMLGLPFRSTTTNILGVIAFTVLLWFCGQTLYISFDLLVTLRDIVNKPTDVPFMLLPNPAVSKLQTYYSTAALTITFLYTSLVVAIWQGPYGINTVMLIWLTVLAFYPTSMLVWSFTQIHTLIRNIKHSHLKIINDEIQKNLRRISKSNSVDDVDRLDKLIKIQGEVSSIKEWNFAFGNSITFVLTSLAGVIQVIISIREILKP